MTLRTKFLLVLIPLLVVSLSAVIFAIYGSTNIKVKTGFVKNDIFPILNRAGALNDHVKATKSGFVDAINGDEFFAEQIAQTQSAFNIDIDTLYSITQDYGLKEIKINYNNFVSIAITTGTKLVENPDEFSDDISIITEKAQILSIQIESYLQSKEKQFGIALLSIDASSEDFVNAFAIVGLSLLIVMVILTRIILSSTRTIRNLATDAEGLSKGDLKKEIETTRSDELGILQGSFERMRSSLNGLINNLESKVEDRTKDLNRKNKALNDTLSKLKQAQTQLIQSEKMVSLGQLTAGIAHEINNPINFVLNGITPLESNIVDLFDLMKLYIQHHKEPSEALTEEIAELKDDIEYDDLEPEILQLCNSIKIGAKRTSEIVNGLRTFSRTDESEKKLADIHEGIDSTLAILNPKMKGRVDVIKEYGPVPCLECFPGQLNQVFMNILANAHQAIGENKGTITVGTKKVDDTHIAVTITDSGPGMTEETKEKIFEPFFTTKDVGEGTGLGMSITFGIIQKHKGSITIDSEIGVGTTFTITLPM
ncbi:MAG: ATP-binding protein [Fibrobacterales bacterium]